MSIRPLVPLPEELHAAPAVASPLGGIADNRPLLLELRTEAGARYVCPSRMQRIRLRWTFRHFHVLPPQVLSRRDQRLIEKLSHTALVTPTLPVANDTIIGVVEKARFNSKESGPRLVPVRTEEPVAANLPQARGVGSVLRGSFLQWGTLGMLVAVSAVVILAGILGVNLLARTAQVRKPPPVSGPIGRAAMRVPSPALPLLETEEPKRQALVMVPQPTFVGRQPAPPASAPETSLPELASLVPQKIDDSSATVPEHPWVTELPQGRFLEPVVSDPNLVGEVRLKALIAPDGSVKDVTLVSGDPKLAEAGMHAVRLWHYGQYQALGRQSEAETIIRMNFFGEDAVSITSVSR